MSQTIHGTYKNGTVLLDRLPEGVTEARVVVEQSKQEQKPRKRGILRFGMFAPPDGQYTSDEDLERMKKSWNAKLDE